MAKDPQANALAPASLDADTILQIHRHKDGRIAIARKLGKDYENLFSITPEDLRGTFHAFKEWLLDNAYFSTQAYHKAAPSGWTHKPTGLPAIGVDRRPRGQRRFGRVTENLRYLNCLSCDIDCGRSVEDAKSPLEAVPWREAQRRVDYLQDTGQIPAVSVIGYSGRGLYVIWLLHSDKDPTHSAPAYDHDVVTWKAIQRELIARMETAPLPVDHQGSLITQVYRIGGSKHPKGTKARYFVYAQTDANRKIISYSLQELAEFFKIPTTLGDLPEQTRLQAKPATYRKVKNPGSAPLRSHGYLKRYALLAQDLLTLERHYGGFRKRNSEYPNGHRSPKYGRKLLLTIYAQALIRSQYSPKMLRPPNTLPQEKRQELLTALETMAANCKPPYGSDGAENDPPVETILEAVLSEYGKKIPPAPHSVTLCAALGVTADMARELDLKTIRPPEVARERDAERPTQEELIQERLEFAREYLRLCPNTSARKLAKAYKENGFRGANHQTANDDLNTLGHIARPAGRRRRLPE